MNLANQELLDKIHIFRKTLMLFIDLGSTHSDTHGEQESSSYNFYHYGTMGFHPLVAFDGATGGCLKAKLLPENVYTSTDVVEFIQPLIEHYNQTFPKTSLFLRGDSGFTVPAFYDLYEKKSVYFIIWLKSNPQLQSLAKEYHHPLYLQMFPKLNTIIEFCVPKIYSIIIQKHGGFKMPLLYYLPIVLVVFQFWFLFKFLFILQKNNKILKIIADRIDKLNEKDR